MTKNHTKPFSLNLLNRLNWYFYWCLIKIEPMRWWLGKKMPSSSRTSRLRLFWIVCWQACFLSPSRPVVLSPHAWLPRCVPGLSWEAEAYMAHWKPLTHLLLPSISGKVSLTSTYFCVWRQIHAPQQQTPARDTSSDFGLDVEVNLGGHLWDRLRLDPGFFLPLLRVRKLYPPSKFLNRWKNTELFELDRFLVPRGSQTWLLVSIFWAISTPDLIKEWLEELPNVRLRIHPSSSICVWL